MHRVSAVARRVGLPPRTVRYYDHIDLVRPGVRSDAGYRLYAAEDEGKLRFVKQARSLGLSLDEIKQLLAVAEAGCCGEVLPELHRLLEAKLEDLDARIADLTEFRARLAAFRDGRGSACGCTGHSPFCGCLEDAPQLVQLSNGKGGHRNV